MDAVCEEWSELKLPINSDDKLSNSTKGGRYFEQPNNWKHITKDIKLRNDLITRSVD
jgi:hypothetical protein